MTKKHTSAHRAKVQLIHDILMQVIKHDKEGIPKYHCQCAVAMGSRQFLKYIDFCIQNDLLFVTNDNRLRIHKGHPRMLLHATSKAILFLKLFSDMSRDDLLDGLVTVKMRVDTDRNRKLGSNKETNHQGEGVLTETRETQRKVQTNTLSKRVSQDREYYPAQRASYGSITQHSRGEQQRHVLRPSYLSSSLLSGQPIHEEGLA